MIKKDLEGEKLYWIYRHKIDFPKSQPFRERGTESGGYLASRSMAELPKERILWYARLFCLDNGVRKDFGVLIFYSMRRRS